MLPLLPEALSVLSIRAHNIDIFIFEYRGVYSSMFIFQV